jgi:anti-sigma factor RsiW
VESLFSAYLEEESSPAETRFLEGHLTACPRCRQGLEEMRSVLSSLSRLPRVAASDDFTARVLARTRGLAPAGLEEPMVIELPVTWWRRAAVPMAAAAALALVVFGVSRIDFGERTSPSTQALDRVVDAAEEQALADAGRPVSPEVQTIEGLSGVPGEGQPLGMARDAYLLENYILKEPAGGGIPTLTRAGATPRDQVLVTF